MNNKYIPLFIDALTELASQKLRTLLTLLGIVFGVGAVIAMLNIGEGAEKEALKMIDSMGLHNLIIEKKLYSEEELKEVRQESFGLSISDSDAALKTLPFVLDKSVKKNIKQYSLYSDFGKTAGKSFGVDPSHFVLSNLTVSAGRLLNNNDELNVGQVAVLGIDIANSLFPKGDPIGQYIKLNHLWLTVVGVLHAPQLNKKEFQGIKLGGDRESVFIPLSTSLKKLKSANLSSEIDTIKLAIKKEINPGVAAKAVTQLFKLRHGDSDDYTLIIPAKLMAQQKKTQQIFNIVMACVAGISLLVGGIGIMNIMLANVLERTKEIGLLRAVGATQQDIKLQFLAESLTISVLGGFLGIAFGLILSEFIGFYSGWAVTWSMSAIMLSLSICIIVGVSFGVFPAIKASKLNPIEALHNN